MAEISEIRLAARDLAEDHSFDIRVEVRSGGKANQKQLDLRDQAKLAAQGFGEHADSFMQMYDEEISAIASDHLATEAGRLASAISWAQVASLILMAAVLAWFLYMFL